MCWPRRGQWHTFEFHIIFVSHLSIKCRKCLSVGKDLFSDISRTFFPTTRAWSNVLTWAMILQKFKMIWFSFSHVYSQNLLRSLMYRNVLQSSESQSETSSSAESDWSDINSIALQLGLHIDNVCVERFKVDRQKLENMIKSNLSLLKIYSMT